jgi:methanogenic corrinoid protein MtbC1
VIGTVAGDLHSIGQSMVGAFLTATGYRVIDLGINVPRDQFVAAVRQHGASLVAMSALLTTTMQEQQRVLDALAEAGLREQVKVMVGGGAITPEFARRIGADGYGATAPEAARLARSLLEG